MIKVKTNLLVNFTFPIFDLFEDGTPKEEMKEKIGEHIKKWSLYHKISKDNVKIIPCGKKVKK